MQAVIFLTSKQSLQLIWLLYMCKVWPVEANLLQIIIYFFLLSTHKNNELNYSMSQTDCIGFSNILLGVDCLVIFQNE